MKYKIHVADIGAAALGEAPPYNPLLNRGLMSLSAFDGDDRQKQPLVDIYKNNFRFYGDIIADGKDHLLYVMYPLSGMSSILKPSAKHLKFFNGFEGFGTVINTIPVKSKRLDDIEELEPIDYLKMDVQGSELMVLTHGTKKLTDCVAIHLEVSFIPLYENQPCFGQIDMWMREHGFVPHCFETVKNWSITPTLRDGDFRRPYNQLLEADIIYVKDPLEPDKFSDLQLRKLMDIVSYCYHSPDLAGYLSLELQKRG